MLARSLTPRVLIAAGLLAAASADAFGAPCAEPSSSAELRGAAARVEGAFSAMKIDGVQTGIEELRGRLPCAGEALTPVDVGAIHRAEAWDAWVGGDADGTRAALWAARSAQPGWVLPQSLAPDGNPLRVIFDAYPGEGDKTAVDLTEGCFLQADGVPADGLPATHATVVQILSADGAVVWTGWLAPGETIPEDSGFVAPTVAPPVAATIDPAPPSPEPTKRARAPGRGRTVALLGTSAAAAVASGLLYGRAVGHRAAWEATDPPVARSVKELDALAKTTNRSLLASGGLLLVAGGLGVTTWVTWEW